MFHKAPKIFANLVTLCSLEGAKSFGQNFRDLGEFPAQGNEAPPSQGSGLLEGLSEAPSWGKGVWHRPLGRPRGNSGL